MSWCDSCRQYNEVITVRMERSGLMLSVLMFVLTDYALASNTIVNATGRLYYGHINVYVDRQTDRQTDRQRNGYTHTHTDTYT